MTSNNTDSDSDAVWIDVRTPEEYASRSIPGHINIPHDVIEGRIDELNLNKQQSVKLYCRTGRRSGLALELLQNQGFTDVENVGSFESALDLNDNTP